jgi:hypothetical protein
MRIDVQIPAHLRPASRGRSPSSDLEGREIVAEVQATMAAFTKIRYK